MPEPAFIEPILDPRNERDTALPVDPRYQDLWELYDTHLNAFWSHKEIDFTKDRRDWKTLDADQQKFIKHILAFFAVSDSVVGANLADNFSGEVMIQEARLFYGIQKFIEDIHAVVYSRLIETLTADSDECKRFIVEANEIPTVGRKNAWAKKWASSDRSFAERLVAFAVIEGVFFSGAFCSIFWLKSKNIMVGTLGHTNEFISRDEALHVKFAVTLFGHLHKRPSVEIVHEIFKDAVSIEKEFICDAIPCRLVGMNSELMSQYIEFVSDRLLVQLGYPEIFGSENPFLFMNAIGIDGKTNFFEKRVSEYKLSNEDDDLTYADDELI